MSYAVDYKERVIPYYNICNVL